MTILGGGAHAFCSSTRTNLGLLRIGIISCSLACELSQRVLEWFNSVPSMLVLSDDFDRIHL